MSPDQAPELDSSLRALLASAFGLSPQRAAALEETSPLLGAMPELDSLSLAGLLPELEDRFGISIEDDEVTGELFETYGSLRRYVAAKAAA